MLKLNLDICITFLVFLFFIHASKGYLYPENVFEEMKWMLTPQDFGNHLAAQLTKNESRLLSSSCRRDLHLYYKGLFHFQPWAFLMFDSNAKFPSGLLRGHAAELGAFDQCLNIKNNELDIRGKYCLGRLKIYNFTNGLPIPFNSMSKKPKLLDLPEGTVYIPWGVCLPDSCSSRDFRILRLFLLGFTEDLCQTKRSLTRDIDNGDIAAISILAIIAAFIICSTTYDVATYYFSNGCGLPILRSFSLFSNFLKLVTIKYDPDAIACTYGLRTLSMLAVMYGFSYFLLILSPLINWIDVLKWVADKNRLSVLEAIICGDTFFVMSGVLISYNYLNTKEKGFGFNVFVYYLRKIIRLTPALGITVLIHATLLRHMGSGPLWPPIRDSWLVNNCRDNWWTSLFYIQNYAVNDIRDVCILQTWQLSADMQLYLLSPLILLPLDKAPKFTLSAVAFLLICSILSPFLTSWVYQLKAVLASSRSLMDVLKFMKYFYFPTHTRASSWLIGFLMGYILYKSRKPKARLLIKKKLNVFIVSILWVLSIAVMVFCVMIGREMIDAVYDWLRNAFHTALIRPLWSVAISWIIFACVHGYGGPINWLLSSPLFQVLSRITYCTYLINISIMFIMTHQTRIGTQFSDYQALENFIKYSVISLAIGLVWTLLFESPMISIIKILFGQKDEEDIISIQRKKSTKEIN